MLRVDGLEVLAAGDLLVAVLAGDEGAFAANVRLEGPLTDGVLLQLTLGNGLRQDLGIANALETQRGEQLQKRGVHQ